MGRYVFRLPDIGEGIAEAEIVALHVAVGDRVEEDQQIADMMTDKATVEMEAPVSGIIVEIGGALGDVIAIGSTLVVIETDAVAEADVDADVEDEVEPQSRSGEAGTSPSESSQIIEKEHEKDNPIAADAETVPVSISVPAPAAARVLASPAVRDRARMLAIDLSQVKPSEDGRVRHADLDAYLRYNSGAGYARPAAARQDEPVRVIGLRKRIAENMAASKRAIPHFTYVEEMEVTALEAMRADLNAARGERPKLTMLPFLIVAICRTLPQFPMLNARYDDEAGVVTRHGAVHMGMATQTDAGLMVPVIRNAEAMNVWQLASEISRLAEAARSGKARSEELSGSTLTITSLGALGGVATTPVINRPEVAIIGPNRIVERPVFTNEDGAGNAVRRAKLMNLSISCDHRVVDGWDAASFVQALKRVIETPVLLFAD
ncbi:2-oxo acid dehydrogenase subunit E2 [Sphingomonas lacunae]|uniref:Dihydrolipoamide acetyltransferase component of pyruvate dehydrogenase complex n=1 Tax=Sphingomonas lacunae TaxID=2698828 RepID=A0A6M4AUW9_9SPHN|nr:dihydrolipoamide acetyltransferase family protein [Sphingomonas lacunae]QJQ32883.1 2-oxo acid dehydrogenase subunit E2 [Sphingomonas lacunae]